MNSFFILKITMVLTVTLNPLLERRLIFDAITRGRVNRTCEEEFKAGGKGINISRQLNNLKIQNQALTFIGGNNGKIFRRILQDEKIDHAVVSMKNELRSAALILEKDKKLITSYFGPNSNPATTEINEFKSKLEKMMHNCSIVIFAGSSPSEAASEIFPFGIKIANEHDKISIVDTYGTGLQQCIDEAPTVIHNNLDEINKSLGIELKTETDKIDFLNYLYSKNVKLAFLTDGPNPVYASKYDFIYKIEFPKVNEIDSTGSGDAFVAGIAYGLEKNLVFDDFVMHAVSLGAVNAGKWDVCNSTLEGTESFMANIDITPIGKKMKIIDDSPTI